MNRRTSSGDGSEGSAQFTDTNPSIHLLYRAFPSLSLRAAFARAVNRPSTDELAPFEDERNDRFVTGNPALAPARSYNLDFGFDYAPSYGFLGVNFFNRAIRGIIEEVDTGIDKDGKDVFQFTDVGDGWTRGIEIEERLSFAFASQPLLQGLSLWANQTFNESRLTDASGRSRPFKDQPKFIANAGLDYAYPAWGTIVTLAWNHVGTQREFKPNGTVKATSSTNTIDVAVRQRVYGNFYMFLEANNLTNQGEKGIETLTSGGFSTKDKTIGRSFLFGLTWYPFDAGAS